MPTLSSMAPSFFVSRGGSKMHSRIKSWRITNRRQTVVHKRVAVLLCAIALSLSSAAQRANDPLPSWNQGPSKRAIVGFVTRVTTKGSSEFISPENRIAVFDNDGTLWTEQPIYTQLAFVLDRVKALAPQHPEWNDKEPFKSVLSGDVRGLESSGEKGLIELLSATHAGMSTEDFSQIVSAWISHARHPRFKRPYTECVYQPMLELLTYLRKNNFETYMVSGGGIEFMRPWAQQVYGIPPERVIGSSIKTEFEIKNGKPILLRLPEVDFVNDGPDKPVGINKFIGKRPVAAFGNSDGDLEMLQWTAAGEGPRLVLLVHHTDAEREYAYDRDSQVGKLDKALDEATAKGWAVVDMKQDWKTIFPPRKVHHRQSTSPVADTSTAGGTFR
jgi:phosphoserine phosphatase